MSRAERKREAAKYIVAENDFGTLYNPFDGYYVGTKTDGDGVVIPKPWCGTFQIVEKIWERWQQTPPDLDDWDMQAKLLGSGTDVDGVVLRLVKRYGDEMNSMKQEGKEMAKVKRSTGRIVVHSECGDLLLCGDSQYLGTKRAEDGTEVTKHFDFPRKMAQNKWEEWLKEEPTDEERKRGNPDNRAKRRFDKKCKEHNEKIRSVYDDSEQCEDDGCDGDENHAAEQIDSVSNQKEIEMSNDKKQTESKQEYGKQSTCYAIMATGAKGTRPAMVLTDEQDARDMVAALQAAGAVMEEQPTYELVQTILRH